MNRKEKGFSQTGLVWLKPFLILIFSEISVAESKYPLQKRIIKPNLLTFNFKIFNRTQSEKV